jgi:nitrogen fixation protein NifU and related proteins
LDSRFPELDVLYRDIVLDHFRAPRGRKPMADADIENQGLNPVCGDDVLVSLKIRDGRVADIAVNGRGCAISVASGSMLSELLVGKTREEIEGIDRAFRGLLHGQPIPAGLELGDLEALEGVKHLPVRVKCALLAWTTLADALKMWDGNGNGNGNGDGHGHGHGAKARPEAPSTTEERA